jgi:hypothetical protein
MPTHTRLRLYGFAGAVATALLGFNAAANNGLPPLQPITPPPLPAPFNGKPVEGVQPSAPPAPPNNPKPIHAELSDGTQVEFDLDGSVWILNKDGSKDPAPDGILTLKDGVTFNVKNGNRVDE